jgi:small subunit ribosomal protein S7
MARRREAAKKQLQPDPIYNDMDVSNFISKVMKVGKKGTAERIVYGAFEIVQEKIKENPLKVFKQALTNIRPLVQVKSRRIGGATYQVPVEVDARRGQSIAMRWVLESSRNRKGGSMREKLAQELMDAYKKEGAAIKKREDAHRMAEANKAFAHYRW